MPRRYPVDRSLDLAAVGSIAAARRRIIAAAQLNHLAGPVIPDDFVAGNEVGIAQADFPARSQAEELFRRIFHEIVLFYVQYFAERHLARAHGRVLGMVGGVQQFLFVIGIVVDHHLQRAQHRHAPRRVSAQFVPDNMLQHAGVDPGVVLGQTDTLTEFPYGLRRKPAPPQTGQGGHARVVPAAHVAVLHQFDQPALAQHRVLEVQAGELVLARAGRRIQVVDKPVVQRPVILELQAAQRVGDMFQRIRQALGEIVHGIYAPVIAGAVVAGPANPVNDRVAQVQVGRPHIDFSPQHQFAVGKLTCLHPVEQVQALCNRPVAPGAVGARFRQGAAVFPDLLCAHAVHVGLALFDQADCKLEQPRKIIRGKKQPVFPVEPQPADIILYGLHVLHVLFFRVGVIEAQVAFTPVLRRHPEIQADGLGMADMEETVGLGRETRVDAVRTAALFYIIVDDLADKMCGGRIIHPAAGPQLPLTRSGKSPARPVARRMVKFFRAWKELNSSIPAFLNPGMGKVWFSNRYFKPSRVIITI